uniref:Ubiquitin carboxyl-terminal hydrolase n=1 Tax=Strigamia maritima TaxID=126957 RepID=T1JNX2_STRMM
MDKERAFTLASLSFAAALAGIYILWGPSSQRTVRRRRSKGLVPGLVNLGNTCFLNAVLQALASCPSFVLWLATLNTKIQNNKNFIDETEDTASYLCTALLKTLQVLSNKKRCDSVNYTPNDVINSLKANFWVISAEEQDAHELYFVLSSTLDEEISKAETTPSLNDASKMSCEVKLEKDCMTPSVLDQIPQSPFKGLLANQLMCRNCGYKCPVKCDTFDSLSLPIPASNLGQMTLYNCLQHFVISEVVSNVECEKCQKITAKSKPSTFLKQLTIARLPINLCIHIQRTVWLQNGMPMKRFDHVTYPEYLIMDDFMYKQQNPQMNSGIFKTLVGGSTNKPQEAPTATTQLSFTPLNSNSFLMQKITEGSAIKSVRNLYQLQAVIVHLGDVFSGHFVTYRRGPSNNSWYMTSDTEVKEVPFSEVAAAPAYVLFYEKSVESAGRNEKAMCK